MKLTINHTTRYAFSNPVFLEPHTLRFYPQQAPNITVESFDIDIQPTPQVTNTVKDTDNNIVQMCWFLNTHRELTILTQATLDIQPVDPFNFIIEPASCSSLPMAYPDGVKDSLVMSLKTIPINQEILQWAEGLAISSDNDTIRFLHSMCSTISNTFELEYRELGPPLHPDETFARKTGSCRDLAWLQIQALRHMGFAARFVSGYLYLNADDPQWELHGWVEVFIPGAGWRGLDPSHGIFASDGHIPLAANAKPEETMPVTGTYRRDATCDMTTELILTVI